MNKVTTVQRHYQTNEWIGYIGIRSINDILSNSGADTSSNKKSVTKKFALKGRDEC